MVVVGVQYSLKLGYPILYMRFLRIHLFVGRSFPSWSRPFRLHVNTSWSTVARWQCKADLICLLEEALLCSSCHWSFCYCTLSFQALRCLDVSSVISPVLWVWVSSKFIVTRPTPDTDPLLWSCWDNVSIPVYNLQRPPSYTAKTARAERIEVSISTTVLQRLSSFSIKSSSRLKTNRVLTPKE